MTPPIVTLRYDVLHVVEVDWTLDWRNTSSGRAMDGSNQIVGFGFPRWMGEPQFRLRPGVIGPFQAARDAAQGLAGIWRVPMIDPVNMDRERALRVRKKTLPFDEGPLFSSGVGFQWDPILLAPDGAKKGDKSIRLTGEFLTVGQVVSYKDWPFRILSLLDDPAGGKLATVAPAVRCDIPVGGIVQAVGHGLFQLTDGASGSVAYGLDRMGTPSLSFVEWINR